MRGIEALKGVILKLYDCHATHVSTAPVHETFEGKTVWEGAVEVFDVAGHPRTKQCYAWEYQDDEGHLHYTAVLKLPPVKTPADAVKAAIVAKVRDERKEA